MFMMKAIEIGAKRVEKCMSLLIGGTKCIHSLICYLLCACALVLIKIRETFSLTAIWQDVATR